MFLPLLPPISLLRSCAAATGLLLMAATAQAEGPLPRNVVRFSTSASQEVTQDWLTVTLQANKEGGQAAEVQTGLKQIVEQALADARKSVQANAMEVHTAYFSVQPRYNSAGKVSGWQGAAQIILEGTDMARITQTAGRLSALTVSSVAYGLSRALREQYESSLTTQAIGRFKARAAQIANDFGMKGYALGDVTVTSTEPGLEPRPYLMKAMSVRMEAADVPLPVEPGKGVISVTVSGQVQLRE